MNETIGKLMYFGDPMCSWCFGIAEHLDQLIIHFRHQLDFELVLGGLRPGGGEEWNDSFKQFLREHWDHVHKASGQPFSYQLLEWESFNYDTEPACRAVRIIRDLKPESEFAFFKACQYRFYYENENPLDVEFYLPICEKLSIDKDKFRKQFKSEMYKEFTIQDFRKSQEYGVRGFPTVLLQTNNVHHLITNGFNTFQKMKTKVEAILKS